MTLLEVLEKHGIVVEVQIARCSDFFHKKFHPDATRDRLIFKFRPDFHYYLCLGCHAIFSRDPTHKGPPAWLLEKEREQEESEARSFPDSRRGPGLAQYMRKRMKLKRCVVCGASKAAKVEGIWLCDVHKEASKDLFV